MKPLTLLLLCVFSLKMNAQEGPLLKVEYTAQTRGILNHIVVSSDSIHHRYQDYVKNLKIGAQDWNTLKEIVSGLDLKTLEQLKAPSNESSRDAALEAHVTLIFQNKTIDSSVFDSGNPPEELRELVDQLLSILSK